MVGAEKRVAEIMQECGFINNLWEDIEISGKIRDLEEMARKNRPPTAKKTESLTKFLPPDQAKKLQELRTKRIKIKENEDNIFGCINVKIKKENIKIFKTDKGIFAEQPPFIRTIYQKHKE